MKRTFIALLSLSAVLVSCSSNVDLAIDNPTSEAIEVAIDSLVVEVPPREVVWVEMGKGEHQITLSNDSTVTYNFQQAMYMLNPSLTEYLKYEQLYGDEIFGKMHVSSIPDTTIIYLGMEIEGNYAIVKDLVNPISWDYGPRESLPEMVEMDASERYTTLIKLADPIELINEVSSGMSEETTSSEESTTLEEVVVEDEAGGN